MDKENNMIIYDAVKDVPENAKKEITGGRLRGMTDISPMWRIKILTEQFGPCGVGWKYEVTNRETLSGANGEIGAFVDINLYYKLRGEWSEPIPGTGGSMFVTQENKGLRTDDEAFKKALTDAISVAAKALGVGAKVYWPSHDQSKYPTGTQKPQKPSPLNKLIEDTAKMLGQKPNQISNLIIAKFGTDGKLPNSKVDEATKYLQDLQQQHKMLAGQQSA